MTNSERLRESKKLIQRARKLLEPMKCELLSEHKKKFKLRYDDSDPLPPHWEECQQLSHAVNQVISMIVDLKELEQTSISLPI